MATGAVVAVKMKAKTVPVVMAASCTRGLAARSGDLQTSAAAR
jgi:hypothetical protein